MIREDLLLLRHTFDLHLGRSRDCLEASGLNQGENLPESKIKDFLIVGLHIKGDSRQFTTGNDHCQVGLSILDTRHLAKDALSNLLHQSLFLTRDFCIGSEKYFKKHSWKFCFGETTRQVTLELLRQEIYALISNREIILVAHGGSGPNGVPAFLKAADIDLKSTYIIDTQKAAQHPLCLESRCSLEKMLELLKCPFHPGMLSNAGNMANFTLRAFLLLAALDATNATGTDLSSKQALVSALERTGREFVPLEEFVEKEKIAERKEYNRAQNRRQRNNAQLKEQRTTKKYVPTNETDLKTLREAVERMDKSFDETTAKTLAGWWKAKAGVWKMVGEEL